jgi:hypothetical protein
MVEKVEVRMRDAGRRTSEEKKQEEEESTWRRGKGVQEDRRGGRG